MLTEQGKLPVGVVVCFVIVVVIATLGIIMNSKQSAQVETQTDIDVTVIVGGVDIRVSNCWGHRIVVFQSLGFEEDLNLDRVIYYNDGSVFYVDPNNLDWDGTWTPRYRSVLFKIITGGKPNTSNTPSSK